MFTYVGALFVMFNLVSSDIRPEDVELLNKLPLDKLLHLKSSLQDIVTFNKNTSLTEPSFLERFGAQAMAMKGPPVKRTDYGDGIYKKDGYSKISNIFSMSVTTLAFLAFGGYLLCLIVQAVKSKETMTTPTQPTFFVSAGIKKKPQPQFASYGRRRRDNRPRRYETTAMELNLPPDVLFSALLDLCEGYAKWNRPYGNFSFS